MRTIMDMMSDAGHSGGTGPGGAGGPLAGLKVVELAGMGPGPHAAMLLADLGADVVRVQRPGLQTSGAQVRGRRVVVADLCLDRFLPAGAFVTSFASATKGLP
jgi:CoA-transferase family III